MAMVLVPADSGTVFEKLLSGATSAGWPPTVTVASSLSDPARYRPPAGCVLTSSFALLYVAPTTASSICSLVRFPAASLRVGLPVRVGQRRQPAAVADVRVGERAAGAQTVSSA